MLRVIFPLGAIVKLEEDNEEDSEHDELTSPKTVDHPDKAVPKDRIPVQKRGSTAREPRFERRLVPITAVFNAVEHSDALYPWSLKMAVALGVEHANWDASALTSQELCGRALDYLLEKTSDFQVKYVLEFEGLLVKQINSRFETVVSLLDNVLQTPADALPLEHILT